MYYFFKYLGWVNITLLALVITHFLLRRISKYCFKNKSKGLRKLASAMSKAHPFIAGALVVSAFFHGWNLAGGIRLHSGYIAFAAILLQLALGTMVKYMKKKPILIIHRLTGLALVTVVVGHVLLMKL